MIEVTALIPESIPRSLVRAHYSESLEARGATILRHLQGFILQMPSNKVRAHTAGPQELPWKQRACLEAAEASKGR